MSPTPSPDSELPAEAGAGSAQAERHGVRFATMATIDLAQPQSWQRQVFLTLDIDWASDEAIGAAIDILETRRVPATWFITHDTPVLARLRENPDFELGIHPNFNFLLMGRDDNGRDAEEVVGRLMEVVPEAKSVRSHSTTQGSRILDVFKAAGLTHESNHFLPHDTGMPIRPWGCWTGLVRVPYFWEDDVAFLAGPPAPIASLAAREGLRAFDFHPIHIVLNTDHADRYEAARTFFHDHDQLRRHANDGCYGVRDQLLDLLDAV